MDISSATSLPVQPAPQPTSSQKATSESLNEGTRPDGDTDKDDSAQVRSVAPTSNTPQTTATLGNNLNIIA